MPTYEYECDACSHKLEAFQKMSDDPLVECPECGKEKLRRLFGVPGLKFVGPGFYVNDYPKDKGGP